MLHIDFFSVLNKGQVMSNYFRLMNKNAGFTWVQSCATLICNTKNAEEQSIICVNYVLSGPQYQDVVMDECQLNLSDRKVNIKQDCDYPDQRQQQTVTSESSKSKSLITVWPSENGYCSF